MGDLTGKNPFQASMLILRQSFKLKVGKYFLEIISSPKNQLFLQKYLFKKFGFLKKIWIFFVKDVQS